MTTNSYENRTKQAHSNSKLELITMLKGKKTGRPYTSDELTKELKH